ncbi:MAG: matrixin family metalloprotease [Bacteriovoracaceae bacterium]|nr:matrixin family metalloprotease [Bacteriovoracaceae bacterium]
MRAQVIRYLVVACILLVTARPVYSYVHGLQKNGNGIKWPVSTSSVNFYVNPSNNNTLTSEVVSQIVSSSISQWNTHTPFETSYNILSGVPTQWSNDIYFTTDRNIFTGSGVVGVTRITFAETNGHILETDIILNDNVTFYNDKTSSYYLGNVIAHELGHALGLGHSQSNWATMFYYLSKGQASLNDDDIAGVFDIYSHTYPDGTKGRIYGKIVGGSSLIGIFSTHVQAISLKKGKVVASVLSNFDGSFEINGLDKSDTYYLYIEPVSYLTNLPVYYWSAKKDFCALDRNYRGSFFQTCHSSDEGFPQGIQLTDSNYAVDVGNVTIRCRLDVPPEFLDDKVLEETELDMGEDPNYMGNAFVGFFTDEQVASKTIDEFVIDLKNYAVSDNNKYLTIKLISQSLYAPLKVNLKVYRETDEEDAAPIAEHSGITYDEYGNKDIEILLRVPLQIGGVPNTSNVYQVKVTPEPELYTTTDYVDSAHYLDTLHFYFIMISISENTEGTYSTVSSKNYDRLLDNSFCSDGVNSYAVRPRIENANYYSVNQDDSDSRDGSTSPFACGSIGGDGGNNNPWGGVITLILGLLIAVVTTQPFIARID